VDVNIALGWNMGGPWITKEKACRWFLQSETSLKGPQEFSGKLPLPNPKDGYDSPPHLGVETYINLPIEVSGQPGTSIDFIHWATAEADFYVLANRSDRAEKATVTFRQSGRHPELWNPVDGTQRDLSKFTVKGGTPACRSSSNLTARCSSCSASRSQKSLMAETL
jgi:hypothetical protein